ncbi:UNVERIFIED_CONTAM: 50S ribosomal protein L3, chloroplastic [Sesamum indicum]
MSISSLSVTVSNPTTKPLSSSAAAIPSSSFLLRLPIRRLSSLSLNASSTRPPLISASMEAGIGVMGTKLGMMSYFDSSGAVIPVTVVGFREGNIVTQVKTEATDGYDAVQVGYRRVRDRKLTKPELGHLEKSGIIPLRHLQEFRLQSVEGFEPNQRLAVDELFKEGDLVDVSGTTIGKGFQGGIKRHNFKRGLMSHGSKSHRQLGSIGAGTTPGRVYKGKKMPGRMGGTKTKIRKLKIVKIDNDLNVVIIKGAVPATNTAYGSVFCSLPRRVSAALLGRYDTVGFVAAKTSEDGIFLPDDYHLLAEYLFEFLISISPKNPYIFITGNN